MAARTSAGILLHRGGGDEPAAPPLQVLLAHTGGPMWARRDARAWSIPKGEYDETGPEAESALTAACREFREELGLDVPPGPLRPLGEIRQGSGKRVQAWALAGDLDPASITPGRITIEWPPRSGRILELPEIDRVQWFTLEEVGDRLFTGQDALLTRLVDLLAAELAHSAPTSTSHRPERQNRQP